jgi:hypothetical protein
VADIITSRVAELDLKYPSVSEDKAARLEEIRKEFEAELQEKKQLSEAGI